MQLVDTHCHLQDAKFDDDRDDVIARALDTVDWLVVIGDDLETSKAGLELTGDRVHAAVGVHPYHAGEITDDAIVALRELARHEGAVAIGEIGLDYYKYNETPRAVQQEALCRQLELASELALPVVIHNRDAHDDLADILGSFSRGLAGGVMHCFAGDEAFLERCLSWEFYISFAGNVTFPKAEELRRAAERVPLDRLLVETDSPYLAPQPVRGKRNEPAYVRHTADALAELKGVAPSQLGQATSQNAAHLFGVAKP